MRARHLELVARWYVFFFLNVYASAKLIGGQFYHSGRLPTDVAAKTVTELSAFELAWTFMGHSFAYMAFIGLSEMLGAWLLLWERTKLLGVAVLLPILVHILVFDVIFLDRYGALASATIYTALLVLILVLNRERVVEIARIATQRSPIGDSAAGGRLRTVAIVAVAMALLFAIDQLFVNLLGHGEG